MAAARRIACSIARLLGRVADGVEDDDARRTHSRAERPQCALARLVGGLAGIEKLWFQRVDTFPAAKPPKTTRTSQQPITAQRYRTVRCARRVSMGFSCSLRPDSITDDSDSPAPRHRQSADRAIPRRDRSRCPHRLRSAVQPRRATYAGRHDPPPPSPQQAPRRRRRTTRRPPTLAARLDRRQRPFPPCGRSAPLPALSSARHGLGWPAARRRCDRRSGALPRAVVAAALAAGPRRLSRCRSWPFPPRPGLAGVIILYTVAAYRRWQLAVLVAAARSRCCRVEHASHPQGNSPGGVLPRRHARHGGGRRLGHVPPQPPPGAARARAPRRGRGAAAHRADPLRRAHADRAGDARRARRTGSRC